MWPCLLMPLTFLLTILCSRISQSWRAVKNAAYKKAQATIDKKKTLQDVIIACVIIFLKRDIIEDSVYFYCDHIDYEPISPLPTATNLSGGASRQFCSSP